MTTLSNGSSRSCHRRDGIAANKVMADLPKRGTIIQWEIESRCGHGTPELLVVDKTQRTEKRSGSATAIMASSASLREESVLLRQTGGSR